MLAKHIQILKPVFTFGFLLSTLFAFSQENKPKDTTFLKNVVFAFSHDSMQGRGIGTNGIQKAILYINQMYENSELTPYRNSFNHYFWFTDDEGKIDTAVNIIGIINNNADSSILFGAHYDHLGYGGSKSRSFTSSKIHPGADDNASGVAAMLSLAYILKDKKNAKYNYIFVAFSAHESGLFGSKHIANDTSSFIKSNKISLMINIDMIGKLSKTDPMLRVMHRQDDNQINLLCEKAKINHPFTLRYDYENYINTDAKAFADINIPIISITTGNHDDYHKTSDIAEKINYEGINKIVDFVVKLIELIED